MINRLKEHLLTFSLRRPTLTDIGATHPVQRNEKKHGQVDSNPRFAPILERPRILSTFKIWKA